MVWLLVFCVQNVKNFVPLTSNQRKSLEGSTLDNYVGVDMELWNVMELCWSAALKCDECVGQCVEV